jgi:hypothetical protein
VDGKVFSIAFNNLREAEWVAWEYAAPGCNVEIIDGVTWRIIRRI